MSNLSLPQNSSEVLLRPVAIPETELERYISFKHALNLRFPDEDTGDWHFQPYFFEQTDSLKTQKSIPLAGKEQPVDTTPSLGHQGVRDMSSILSQERLPIPSDQPVYVANHYRAIADLAMLDLQKSRVPSIADNAAINGWLDSQEQVAHLKRDYLERLAIQLSGEPLRIFKQWIQTVKFI
ncbi:hypothetical protein [Acaryochloris sp. CCMEE 5410]|uniref:hypothetical protein n=1 Tax=Acaryochloris sp. CCMEE 5410 TaxID=310037 RepID=UPI00024837C7|nr:hypothetical protein [Acaryochloris sp. CCMEE 5410]KAI9129604.1 hypothetical protein ON05_033445 [Acaryochloris sp. CCMEE 5410]